ncbi:DUF4156 domain-containing protein [Cognatiluteimonas telluris]|jgi:hypothetical protein|uniref:DUF4156 domain-containing protein n=1 Tax=Cognatiluteimonas telluris TaxID=1104775 RepID=UPI00140D3368|nr:DUF4156 domain-containing protein [Lysobacter telluris]
MRNAVFVLAALTATTAGCTWVHMAPGASAVRVVAAAPSGCQPRGEVEVSVKASLGPYERNPLRVHDELETLARNEAPGLSADTVQPLDGPEDGVQRYAMWRCGR